MKSCRMRQLTGLTASLPLRSALQGTVQAKCLISTVSCASSELILKMEAVTCGGCLTRAGALCFYDSMILLAYFGLTTWLKGSCIIRLMALGPCYSSLLLLKFDICFCQLMSDSRTGVLHYFVKETRPQTSISICNGVKHVGFQLQIKRSVLLNFDK